MSGKNQCEKETESKANVEQGLNSLSTSSIAHLNSRLIVVWVGVDPEFCPSTLEFILWVSHSPIILVWRR